MGESTKKHRSAVGIIHDDSQSLYIYLDGELHAVRSYAGMGGPGWAFSLAMDVFQSSERVEFFEHIGDFGKVPRLLSGVDWRQLADLDEDWERIESDNDAPMYRAMLKLVLHRGFRRMGFEFEPGEADPEGLRRGFVDTIATFGEQHRLSVKVESPSCVAVLLRGGHELPLKLPRKLGLGTWEKQVSEFIYSEDFADERLIKPGKLSLDEARGKTADAVREMELDDFLTVDTCDGRVRLRHTRDVAAEEVAEAASVPARRARPLPNPNRPSPRTTDDYFLALIEDFAAADVESRRVPLRWFAENIWGDDRERMVEGMRRGGGVGPGMGGLLTRLIAENELDEWVAAVPYAEWELRLEKPGHSGERRRGEMDEDGTLHLSDDQRESVGEFFIGFWWDLQETTEPGLTFPLEDYLSWVHVDDEDRSAHLAQAAKNGGMDWVVYQVLCDFIGKRDKDDRFLVRYYGRDDVRVEEVDGGRRLREAAEPVSGLLHSFAEDGSNGLLITLKDEDDSLEELGELLREEVELRGLDNRIVVRFEDDRSIQLGLLTEPHPVSDIMFADEMEELDAETALVVGFLDGGATELRLRFDGLSKRELLHRATRIVAAAQFAGRLGELEATVGDDGLTLIRS